MDSPQPRVKQRCTQKSTVEKSIVDSLEDGESPSTRLSCITLDLKRTLKLSPVSKYIHSQLNNMVRYIESFTYLSGLFVNYVVIRRMGQNLDLPRIQKVFCDRCWAAISNRDIEYSHLFDEFVTQSGLDTRLLPPMFQ